MSRAAVGGEVGAVLAIGDILPGDVGDPADALKGTRPAHFGDGYIDTPLYDGLRLVTDATIEGPALIEAPFTVLVVAPGCRAHLDGCGNYDVTFA